MHGSRMFRKLQSHSAAGTRLGIVPLVPSIDTLPGSRRTSSTFPSSSRCTGRVGDEKTLSPAVVSTSCALLMRVADSPDEDPRETDHSSKRKRNNERRMVLYH